MKNYILNLKRKICLNYGNAAYLALTGKRDFNDVCGTKLWYLWYNRDRLSIATLDFYYGRYLAGKYDKLKFYFLLKKLQFSLMIEFKKTQKLNKRRKKHDQYVEIH